MAATVERRRNSSGAIAIRPFWLAAGLGLLWFIEVQEGGLEIHTPPWGFLLALASRLLADFVGGALLVSLLRILLALGRLGVIRWRLLVKAGEIR
jgi:hypothetical protein